MVFTLDLYHKGLVFSSRFPWKIGTVSFMACPDLATDRCTVEDFRKILDDPFFDGLEIAATPDHVWRKVKPLLGGKWVARGCQPDILSNKLDLNSANPKERSKAINWIKREIWAAAKRGIRMVALCSGPDPGIESRKEARQLLVESLNEICGFAANQNVTIALETFDRDYDKRLLIGPLDEALEVVGAVKKRAANMGLMWDLSHAPMLGENPEDLRRAKNSLIHVHYGCAKRVDGSYIDSHPTFGMEGAVNTADDVSRLLEVLLDIGYSGKISFEVKPEAGQTSEEAISPAKETLMKAYHKIIMNGLS